MPAPRDIVNFFATLAHERNPGTSNEYGVAVPECNYFLWAHNDGDVQLTTSPALLFGVYCIFSLTGAGTTLRDGTGGTDPQVIVLPAMTQGTMINLPGIRCNNGIFIDDSSTGGQILIYWRPQ